MPLEKTKFRKYDLSDKKAEVLSLKLNEIDEEMLSIGMYAFNKHSKGGVLKDLARLGLEKVVLGTFGMDELHKLTRGDRTRIVHERPILNHFSGKGNP